MPEGQKRSGSARLEPGEQRPHYRRVLVGWWVGCACGCGQAFWRDAPLPEARQGRQRRYVSGACRERASYQRRQERQANEPGGHDG